jgi:hypothetical protein
VNGSIRFEGPISKVDSKLGVLNQAGQRPHQPEKQATCRRHTY